MKALSRFDYEESFPHKREGFRVKRKLRDKNARQGLQGDEALAGVFFCFQSVTAPLTEKNRLPLHAAVL